MKLLYLLLFYIYLWTRIVELVFDLTNLLFLYQYVSSIVYIG